MELGKRRFRAEPGSSSRRRRRAVFSLVARGNPSRHEPQFLACFLIERQNATRRQRGSLPDYSNTRFACSNHGNSATAIRSLIDMAGGLRVMTRVLKDAWRQIGEPQHPPDEPVRDLLGRRDVLDRGNGAGFKLPPPAPCTGDGAQHMRPDGRHRHQAEAVRQRPLTGAADPQPTNPPFGGFFCARRPPMTTTTFNHWRDVPERSWRWKNFSPAEIACRGSGSLL